ncbi:MAG: hypothetical protein FJ189_03890 [Gammaproteobacteria bacterium]|nr:hypothetical protein [Gammaproteobacteria bacterium]
MMSEAPFCFFALWGLDVFFEELKAAVPRWRGFLGSAVLISLAGGFRQEGWQLAGILAIYMLFLPNVRRYAVPFGFIGISTFIMWTVGNIAGGHSFMYSLTNVAAAKDHETILKHYSGAMNVVKWLWIFIQSPGPLITGFTLWGYFLAFKRRLPLDLAVISFFLIGPYVALSVVKPEWAPQHRYTVLFGILMLPYAAAAVLSLLPKKVSLAAAVATLLGLTVATQAVAFKRHSKRALPFHDYVASDVTLWNWLAANKTPEDWILIEDTGWRAPGVIVHSGSYRQIFNIIFPYEGPEALEKAMSDTSRSYLLVLHSPSTRWPFLESKRPSTVFKTEDYTVMRVEPGAP